MGNLDSSFQQMKFLLVFVTFYISSQTVCGRAHKSSIKEDASYWEKLGKSDLQKAINAKRYEGEARNVIFFVGDGMGIPTHTMARIYKGQKKGESGEEESLVWEDFPFTGLMKTYSTDKQVPDSAATATALFSGVKTRSGMLGLDHQAHYNVCDSRAIEAARVESIADWGTQSGREVGIVTTARVTHATPAAMYAHSPIRDWEADYNIPQGAKECQDIASQLIGSLETGKIKLAFGGGRRAFRTATNGGVRLGEDLVDEFKKAGGTYLETNGELQEWDYSDKVLGLFGHTHMDYEVDRDTEQGGQPSLTEMTRQALNRMKKSSNGFILMVEGGRIDHAHHQNKAKMALEETLELEKAVKAALEMTDREDTLIIVTADHGHAVTMSGYPERGNPILGFVKNIERGNFVTNLDNQPQPYTTIGYANGPGFDFHFNRTLGFWNNIENENYMSNNFVQMSTFHLDDETHGGEDVSAYAIGPQAHLVSGVHEQSYLAHLVAYAACLREDTLDCPAGVSGGSEKKLLHSQLAIIVFVVFFIKKDDR
eukprot:GFUD01008590.1.p1 GENE.GFUD01008590.1~~GFUD01008590.1.p1  ORF type:complete len:578 (+),score=132.72 GFUD01008590.1:116-1735(+)